MSKKPSKPSSPDEIQGLTNKTKSMSIKYPPGKTSQSTDGTYLTERRPTTSRRKSSALVWDKSFIKHDNIVKRRRSIGDPTIIGGIKKFDDLRRESESGEFSEVFDSNVQDKIIRRNSTAFTGESEIGKPQRRLTITTDSESLNKPPSKIIVALELANVSGNSMDPLMLSPPVRSSTGVRKSSVTLVSSTNGIKASPMVFLEDISSSSSSDDDLPKDAKKNVQPKCKEKFCECDKKSNKK